MLNENMPSVEQSPEASKEQAMEKAPLANDNQLAKPHENGVTTLAKEIITLRKNQELIKAEIAEQREYLLHLLTQTRKIRRYIMFNTIGELLKLLLIFLPLIVAYFALKPYFSQVADGLKSFQDTINDLGGFGN